MAIVDYIGSKLKRLDLLNDITEDRDINLRNEAGLELNVSDDLQEAIASLKYDIVDSVDEKVFHFTIEFEGLFSLLDFNPERDIEQVQKECYEILRPMMDELADHVMMSTGFEGGSFSNDMFEEQESGFGNLGGSGPILS